MCEVSKAVAQCENQPTEKLTFPSARRRPAWCAFHRAGQLLPAAPGCHCCYVAAGAGLSMAWRLTALLSQMAMMAAWHAVCKSVPLALWAMQLTRAGVARATVLASTESGWPSTRRPRALAAARVAALLLLLLVRRDMATWTPPAAATAAACVAERMDSAAAVFSFKDSSLLLCRQHTRLRAPPAATTAAAPRGGSPSHPMTLASAAAASLCTFRLQGGSSSCTSRGIRPASVMASTPALVCARLRTKPQRGIQDLGSAARLLQQAARELPRGQRQGLQCGAQCCTETLQTSPTAVRHRC